MGSGDGASRNFLFHCSSRAYYIYLASVVITSSWQPYMKHYVHNLTFDYGSRVTALWLER
jgi:hypothetical protein